MTLTEREMLIEIRDLVRELLSRSVEPEQAQPPVTVTDADLDHPKYGDPTIKTAPRDWNGPFRSGQRMSESPPQLLDMVAVRCEYFAQKNEAERAVDDRGQPKATHDRRLAAKARGWAKRIRNGWKRPAPKLMEDMPEVRDGFI